MLHRAAEIQVNDDHSRRGSYCKCLSARFELAVRELRRLGPSRPSAQWAEWSKPARALSPAFQSAAVAIQVFKGNLFTSFLSSDMLLLQVVPNGRPADRPREPRAANYLCECRSGRGCPPAFRRFCASLICCSLAHSNWMRSPVNDGYDHDGYDHDDKVHGLRQQRRPRRRL